MDPRRNNCDVSNAVDTTDFMSVNREVARIFHEPYPNAGMRQLNSRGAKFIERYMRDMGMIDLAPMAKQIVHFTGYERPAAQQ